MLVSPQSLVVSYDFLGEFKASSIERECLALASVNLSRELIAKENVSQSTIAILFPVFKLVCLNHIEERFVVFSQIIINFFTTGKVQFTLFLSLIHI